MLNMDQNKLAEVINQLIVNKYMQNICVIRSKILKLYSCFPFTGAPNISDAQVIAVITDLEKFISKTITISNN